MKGPLECLKALGGFLNPELAEKDLKLAAFGSVVVAAIVWLSLALSRPAGITDQWVSAFYGLCALVGLGGTAWAAVDKMKKGGPSATSNPPAPGAQDEGPGGPA